MHAVQLLAMLLHKAQLFVHGIAVPESLIYPFGTDGRQL
jgi:hypothetical protein